MGYSAAWSLSLQNTKQEETQRIIAELKGAYPDADYYINYDGGTNNPGSWYEYQEQLSEFSRKYPDIVFVVDLWGEEWGDVSKTYFKDGKVKISKGVITFEPF